MVNGSTYYNILNVFGINETRRERNAMLSEVNSLCVDAGSLSFIYYIIAYEPVDLKIRFQYMSDIQNFLISPARAALFFRLDTKGIR